MAYDALSLHLLEQELNNVLCGGKITKVYQPEKDEIVLFVHSQSGSYKLLISANASVNRIHLTNYPTVNPQTAPSFCMLLRKHIVGAMVKQISQMPYERVLDFLLEVKDELGYEKQMHLIFELTGKTSNIVLTSGEYVILDSIKHLPVGIDSSRIILAGAKYEFFAPQDKIKPFDYDALALFLAKCNLPLRSALTQNVMGVSADTVAEITYKCNENEHTVLQNGYIVENFKRYEQGLKNPKPCVILNNGTPTFVCPFDYQSKHGERLFFDTLNEAHDNYYYLLDQAQRMSDKAKSVSTLVKNAVSRTEKKLAIQRQSILDAECAGQLKTYGDLILANIYRIGKNATELVCENYYESDCPTVKIALESNLSPQQNAQNYYKKYRKMKSTAEHNTVLVAENEKLLDYLQSVKQSLAFCTEPSDVEQIREELVAVGIVKENKKVKKKDEPVKPLCYKIDGFSVYVGKNNVQNNFVTFKLATASDLWLHTQKIHSSHVVIVSEGKKVPDEVIVKAAEICAFYSQASQGSKIAVDYTARQNVKKPPKSALGFVTYNDYKTVVVNPNRHVELL